MERMNLTKLLKMQKVLDDRIVAEKGLQGVDLLDKKILALQVEFGELANELPEIFKFWSNKKNNYERALKEYVDGLHFILSIGNDLNISTHADSSGTGTKSVITLFAKINRYAAELWWECHDDGKDKAVKWLFTLSNYISLGERLGFTWEQIEQAYYDKNKINHERQESGY